MNKLEELVLKSLKTDEEDTISEVTSLIKKLMIDFSKWIADTKKHGYSNQLYEAMVVNKVKNIEELLEIFLKDQI